MNRRKFLKVIAAAVVGVAVAPLAAKATERIPEPESLTREYDVTMTFTESPNSVKGSEIEVQWVVSGRTVEENRGRRLRVT